MIVFGAGVFGAWTAWRLQQAGKRVLLVDAWGPSHSRSSSGGETRMIRAAYGSDAIYSDWAWRSLADWRWLSRKAGLPVFHRTGVLYFARQSQTFFDGALEALRGLDIPVELLDRTDLARRFPQACWDDVETALFEPEVGVLMARRGVQTLVQLLLEGGGQYLQAQIAPPTGDVAQLKQVRTADGHSLTAEQFVFACGSWLPKLFPQTLGGRIFPTQQDVFFFAPPPGNDRFGPAHLPAWGDFNHNDMVYGFPDIEGRGFKIGLDRHGPAIDPDQGDRRPLEANLERVRAYMARRFPAMAGRPLSEVRVCHYENSSNGHFLIDRHPEWSNVVLAGAGSGHGFKHGPMVGRAVEALLAGAVAEARFSLASKGKVQQRAVH